MGMKPKKKVAGKKDKAEFCKKAMKEIDILSLSKILGEQRRRIQSISPGILFLKNISAYKLAGSL